MPRFLALLLLCLFAAASVPDTALAGGRRGAARPATRRKASPLERSMGAYVRRYLDPNHQPAAQLAHGRVRSRLTDFSGSTASFTVQDGNMKLHGRVWESRHGGLGARVREAFVKQDGKWVPTENPWE